MFVAILAYFSTDPLVTVCRISFWHSIHLPASGILRYFSPQLLHRKDCDEYDRILPMISGRMCVVSTIDATSSGSTALISFAVASCISNFSSIEFSLEYALR